MHHNRNFPISENVHTIENVSSDLLRGPHAAKTKIGTRLLKMPSRLEVKENHGFLIISCALLHDAALSRLYTGCLSIPS